MIKKIIKSLIFGLISVVLVTLGINAADHYDNMSESLIGQVLGEDEGRCPKDMVFVPTEKGGFCIDRYEASASEKCPYKEVSSQAQSRDNIANPSCKPLSEQGQQPWRFLSQSQAMAACAKAGKRLPSDEEWYQASLGTPDRNDGWGGADCQVNNNWDAQPGLTGSGENCQSSYGAFDMIGNVWEWVRTNAEDGKIDGKQLPASGFVTAVDSSGLPRETTQDTGNENYNMDYFWVKDSGVRSVARGGYWDNKSDAGVYAAYIVPPLDFAGTGVGFRCVK